MGADYIGLFLSGLPHCESSVERTAKFARMMAVQSVFAAILAVNSFKETDLNHSVQYLKYTPVGFKHKINIVTDLTMKAYYRVFRKPGRRGWMMYGYLTSYQMRSISIS